MANREDREQLTVAESFKQTVEAYERLAPSKQRDLQKVVEKIRSEKLRLSEADKVRLPA